MRTPNRRDFMKNSAAVGVGLAASGFSSRRVFSKEKSGFNRIKYRDLGSTGFKVSEIGFGAMNMRDPELVHAAIDSGINYIDTAHKYMNGVNEEIIGQVMKTKREKVFLTTKIKSTVPENMPEMIETSLKRLQTDHVDLLLLHNMEGKEHILRDDLMKIFDNARKKGQTRFVGFSAHTFPPDVLDAALESKFWEAVLVGYNYMSPMSVKTSIEKARKAGIAIIAMKNMLTSSWPAKPLEDIRKDKNGKMTASQALIKWVLEDKHVDTAIPGMTSFEHLAEDLAVMEMKMTSDDKRTLMRIGETIKGSYCCGVTGCTGCKDKCPYGVKVNEINRCLGYAYGYGDIRLAHENYEDIPSSSRIDKCADCDECIVKCINGLNLTENIRRAREMFA